MNTSEKKMYKELDKWENFITELVERKKHEAKDKVISGSKFLSFLGESDEWGKEPISEPTYLSSDIEKYYCKKEIQPNVIDPGLMYSIISGDEGYKFAERWISNMLNESSENFGRKGIDELFISEICTRVNYLPKNLFEKSEEEFKNYEEDLKWIRSAISSHVDKGNKKEDLILIIGKEVFNYFLFSPFISEYKSLKQGLGLVIERYTGVPENNFLFSLINKNDLKFRWIFWGLKLNYNIFNLYTYIPLHVWYNVEKRKNFSSNSIAYLKKVKES